jgi:regulatory protein
LAQKLAQRRFPGSEIEAALDRLAAQGYLDDRANARRFVELRAAERGEGRARLRGELLRRGVAAEIADQVLGELLPEDDRAAAAEAARRYTAQRASKGAGAADALARHLSRKGFSRRAILAVLRELPDGPEIDDADLGPDPE